MAYFNHAFCKTFLGESDAATSNGFVTTGSVVDFVPGGTNGVGSFAFVDQSITNAATPWPVQAAAPAGGQPLTLVATALYQNDKVGRFHGGYQEVTKSKMINPRYVSKFYKVEGHAAQNHIIGVGNTPNLTFPIAADSACDQAFFCNENYNLRLDLKGEAALRALNHNAYHNAYAYTGCCDGAVPEQVDPFDVYSAWALDIHADPILSGAAPFEAQAARDQRFVHVGVTLTTDNGTTFDIYLPANDAVSVGAGVYFEADGTTPTAAAAAFVARVEAATGVTFGSVLPMDSYTSAFDVLNPLDTQAGLVMESAFVETTFGDCTFMPTDHFAIEPLLIQASMIDETGDPCVFEQLCISDGITPSNTPSNAGAPAAAIQMGMQVMGTGEQVLRDLILSESYDQNPLNTSRDLRLREITQGYDMTNAVQRDAIYDCYYILHSVPRTGNPSGVYDADQYLLKIPVLDGFVGTTFETFVNTWLSNAGNPVQLETLTAAGTF